MPAKKANRGLSISELTTWKSFESRVRTRNEHPPKRQLTRVIRKEGVPIGWPSDYVADLLDGVAKRRRGHPKLTETELRDQWFWAGALTGQVRYLQAVYRLEKRPAPREAAIKEIARRHDVSRHTLLDRMKNLKRNGPYYVRWWELSLPEADQVVALAMKGVRSSSECELEVDPAVKESFKERGDEPSGRLGPLVVTHLTKTGGERLYRFEDAFDFVRAEMGV